MNRRITVIAFILLLLTAGARAGDPALSEQLLKGQFKALQSRGDAALPDLLAIIRGPDPLQGGPNYEAQRQSSIQGRAVYALGEIGTPKALAELRTLLEKPPGTATQRRLYKQTALEALTTMVRTGQQKAEALALAQKALADPEIMVRAAQQLGEMGERSSVTRLRPIYERSSDSWVKSEVGLALAKLGDASVVPFFNAQVEKMWHRRPQDLLFDGTVYRRFSYLAGESPAVRDRLKTELVEYAPEFGQPRGAGFYPIHYAAQDLLRADALTVELLVQMLTRPPDAYGVRYALDNLRHTYDATRLRRLLDQAVADLPVQAAWLKTGAAAADMLRREAAKPIEGPEMGHIFTV